MLDPSVHFQITLGDTNGWLSCPGFSYQYEQEWFYAGCMTRVPVFSLGQDHKVNQEFFIIISV